MKGRASDDEGTEDPRNPGSFWALLLGRLREHRALLVGSLAFGALSLWLLRRGALPMLPDGAALKRASLFALPVYVLANFVLVWVRSVRFRHLLAPLGQIPLREVLAVNYVFLGANLLLPLRAGDLVRPLLLRRPGKISAWQVLGLVGAERIVDGLLSSLLLALGLLLAPSPAGLPVEPMARLVRPTCLLMVSVFAGGFVVLLGFYFFREFALRATRATLGVFSGRLAELVAGKVAGLAEGLTFLARPAQAVPFLLESVAFWFLNALAQWLLFRQCGYAAGFWEATSILGVLAVGLIVPGPPGFFGIFQMSIYAGLALYLVPADVRGVGSVLVFYMYTGQFIGVILPMLLGLPLSLRAAGVKKTSGV